MSFENGHALLIGVGTHQDASITDVEVTVNDVNMIQGVLQNQNYCGYEANKVNVLTKGDATKAGVLAALDQLAGLGKDQTVFLFYAGHGHIGADGNYYLVTHDAQLEKGKIKAGSGVSEQELMEKLKAIKAERLLMIFNACHSGHLGPEEGVLSIGALGAQHMPSKTMNAVLGTGKGRILIVASRDDQYSYFHTGDQSGTFFGKALVAGLKGGAPNNNNSGTITAFGLYEYLYFDVKETVKDLFGKKQEPLLTTVQAAGPFSVALYNGASTLSPIADDSSLLTETVAQTISESKAKRALRDISGQIQITETTINTGGGAYFGGSVNTGGGSFAGRDMINSGNTTVHGDHIQGDKVGGDKYTAQGDVNISRDGGTVIGRGGVNVGGNNSGNIVTGNNNRVTNNSAPDEIAAAFSAIQAALANSSVMPAMKPAAESIVTSLEAEAQKGDTANETVVQSLMDTLVSMVPDVAEVAIQTFLNPIKGVGVVFQKIAKKALEAKRS
ncbi:MAG: caspase family protein [Chloroflexota bacterium]